MSTAEIINQLAELPEEKQQTASDFIAFLVAKTKAEKEQVESNASGKIQENPESGFGCMKGMFKMAPDFDEPLEEFKEYI
jgi:hypothetical protein